MAHAVPWIEVYRSLEGVIAVVDGCLMLRFMMILVMLCCLILKLMFLFDIGHDVVV